MTHPTPACPQCHATTHIYARIDRRWDAAAQAWVTCPDLAQPLECTACDAEFSPAEAGLPSPLTT